MNGDTADLALHEFALAGVKTGADFDPEVPYSFGQREGAPDRPRGAVEAGEEAVTRRVYLPSGKANELPANVRMVLLQELFPPMVAELREFGRRRD